MELTGVQLSQLLALAIAAGIFVGLSLTGLLAAFRSAGYLRLRTALRPYLSELGLLSSAEPKLVPVRVASCQDSRAPPEKLPRLAPLVRMR